VQGWGILTCTLESLELALEVVCVVLKFATSLVPKLEHFLELHQQLVTLAVLHQTINCLVMIPLHNEPTLNCTTVNRICRMFSV